MRLSQKIVSFTLHYITLHYINNITSCRTVVMARRHPLQKWHMWITCEVPKNTCDFFTCETHVHSWGVSHVKFHMWLFTCVSHVKFHMGFFTCEISHVKFHTWNFTCEISYVNCHMWYFTCEQSYMIKVCNFICLSSHGKINMWYSPCEFSKVKFLMVGHISRVKFHLWLLFYAVIRVAYQL